VDPLKPLEVIDAKEAIVELAYILFEEIPAICIHCPPSITVNSVEAADVVPLGRYDSLAGLVFQ